MDDGEAGEEALRNGLLHDLEGRADEGLAGDDGRHGGQDEHRVEGSVRQRVPEAGAVVLRILHQVRRLRHPA